MRHRAAGAPGGEAGAERTVGGATRLELGLPGGSGGRASWPFLVPRGRPRRRRAAGPRRSPCVFGALGVAPALAEAKAKAQTDAGVGQAAGPPSSYEVPAAAPQASAIKAAEMRDPAASGFPSWRGGRWGSLCPCPVSQWVCEGVLVTV